jgi:hypothetical protein
MALIIRIDVDRPYGKEPFARHVLSRLSSDFYFPKTEAFGYLKELKTVLQTLNQRKVKAYIFFRRCTLPSKRILELISQGGHEIGLHLENSRSFESFVTEKKILERHIGKPVLAVSKHGSGGAKYGFHHYAPYEPDKYIEWAQQSGMKLFLGNLEDPTISPSIGQTGFRAYPAAFWLEPAWRNTERFTVDWLISQVKLTDMVLLIHPENILADPALWKDFNRLLLSHDIRNRYERKPE